MIEAGKLTERVTLAKRQEINPDAPNDYGNTVADWQEQGTVWAAINYDPRGGREAVLAARLQGINTVVIRVRASALTRAVTSDWKAVDARSGVEFAIKSVVPYLREGYLDITAQSGVAA